jgi:hypothetical protein
VEPSWSADRGRDRRGSTPALPATGPEPASAWTEGWRDDRGEREREPRRRRAEERDDRWERDETTSGGTPRPRRLDFELSDDRWR